MSGDFQNPRTSGRGVVNDPTSGKAELIAAIESMGISLKHCRELTIKIDYSPAVKISGEFWLVNDSDRLLSKMGTELKKWEVVPK